MPEFATRRRRRVLAVAVLAWAGCTGTPAQPAPDAAAASDAAGRVVVVERAQRLDPPAPQAAVALPDEIDGVPGQPVHARWRWVVHVDAGALPQALLAHGTLGRLRLRMNGHPLLDEIGPDAAVAGRLPPARGIEPESLVPLPPALLRAGPNEFEAELVARSAVLLGAPRIGALEPLRRAQVREHATRVLAPLLVAAVMASFGIGLLALWARRRDEAQYGSFGAGALLWGLHTAWTVSQWPALPSPHLAVWWNAAYAALVALLVLFALQFTQRARPPITRTLLALPMLAVPLLYAAAAAGVAGPAAQALRAVLVLLAFGALGVVAYHASHRRSGASALFVLAGAASAGLGLRDWLVFREGGSADAVPWTPYAGAPFVVMGSWLLLDQFVRTTRALESVNRGLEQRVAEREAELTARYRDAAALEREQAAGDERQRLLRELHDGLGAKLTQALLRVEQGGLDGAGLSRELRSCLADMRLASETLVPGQTEWSDAVGNFRFRWDALLRAAGLQARWQVELPTSGMTMPPYVALQLLRVMQEALTNVLRHAQATRLAVAVRREGAGLLVRVEDDGRGLPALPPAGARGLADMRTRAAAVGATLVLSQPPGGGTRVELRLSPLPDVAHTGTPLST